MPGLVEFLVNTAFESPYLRLVSVKWPVPFAYPAGQPVRPGRGWIVREGKDLVVFGYGPWLLSNAWYAAQEIEQAAGVTTRLINLPWLNRVDPVWLREAIGTSRAVVTLDNHYVRGGQGDMIAATVAALALDPTVSVTKIGITDLPECGANDEVLAHHGLDIASLAQAFRSAATLPRRRAASQLA